MRILRIPFKTKKRPFKYGSILRSEYRNIELVEKLQQIGLKPKDALHVACAIYTECRHFITTDAGVTNKNIEGITVIKPMDFIRKLEADITED